MYMLLYSLPKPTICFDGLKIDISVSSYVKDKYTYHNLYDFHFRNPTQKGILATLSCCALGALIPPPPYF